MRISIFGAGYVGTVTGACLSSSGHRVTLVDIDKVKIATLAQGKAPFYEARLPELLAKGIEAGLLTATDDVNGAVAETDVSLICVGTPAMADGSINYKYLDAVCAQIGEALRHKQHRHLIIFRSTMLPGTARNRLLPILQAHAGHHDFDIGYNPEFLREGSAVADYFQPTQIVAGAEHASIGQAILDLYQGIDAPRSLVGIEEAEAVKYVSNIWRAHKISFANEISNVMHSWGVDPHKVMNVFFQDTKINMGPGFLQPGFAYGGSCLPKDIRAVSAYAHSHNLMTPLLNAVQTANDNRVQLAIETIRRLGARNIVMLGVSFKPGTDDLRESPYLTLARALEKDEAQLQIHDNHVSSDDVLNVNAEDIDFSGADLIVLSHSIPEYLAIANNAPGHIPILALSRCAMPNERTVYGLSW